MEQVIVFVGILIITTLFAIYAGGRRAMKTWGYDCPKLLTTPKMNKSDKKVDLIS